MIPRKTLAITKAQLTRNKMSINYTLHEMIDFLNATDTIQVRFKYINKQNKYMNSVFETDYRFFTIKHNDLNYDAITNYNKDTNTYIIFLDKDTYKLNINRLKFSLAHELGHICLKHFVQFNFDNIDEYTSKALETEANYFAGELLMPKQAFSHFKHVNLRDLSSHFQLNPSAISCRLDILGIKETVLISPYWNVNK